MQLHNIGPTPGSKHRRKRVGRGDGSGMGGTATRGHKGQMSRSGANHRPYFEGGQITFFRRLPKRGFKALNPAEFHVVNIGSFDAFEAGTVIDENSLREKALIAKAKMPIKVLASGEITKAFTVKAQKFSATAIEKIKAAGGTCEVIK